MVALIFGLIGFFLTFYEGNVGNYDSKARAFKIEPNESIDSEGSSTYYPIYHFKVNRNIYQCESASGSSKVPDKSKNIVYYDSQNPTFCKTEYERSTSKTTGIIFLVIAVVLCVLIFINKPYLIRTEDDPPLSPEDLEKQREFEEKFRKAEGYVNKAYLIYKKIIIGVIITVLFIVLIFFGLLFRQTIKARNYIKTTGVFVERIKSDDIDEDKYVFTDKNGDEHEAIIVALTDAPKEEIEIKYNEKQPEDYVTQYNILSTTGIILYIIGIIVFFFLNIALFNDKLLEKINISVSSD